MSLLRQFVAGVRALFRGSAADAEVGDELQHYLQESAAAHAERGLPADQALRAARLEVGSVLAAREEVRASGWEHAIETFAADVRYAARRLRHESGFTIVVVLTVALGVGATTAIFSVINPILFESLPYPDPRRIVTIAEVRSDGSRVDGTFGMFRGLADGTRSFEALSVFKPWQPTLQGRDHPERLEAQRVSADYFRTLRVTPRLGRNFEAADDRPNAPAVVVLSDAVWRRLFAADPAILGQTITLDARPFTVIGVMGEQFENVLSPSAELWAPMQYDMSQGRAWGHHLRTVGRLSQGTTIAQASEQIAAAGARVLAEQRPETYASEVQFAISALQEDVTRAVKPALLAIFGAAGLVLAIVCANVSNLFLARGVHRRGEFALRAALGAGRVRLMRQMITESLVLALLGGALGIAISIIAVRVLVALGPASLPRLTAIRVDTAVLAFGLVVTTVVGLIFGVIPARQAARSDPQRDIGAGSHRLTGGNRRTRNALVISEVALALVLLVSSGLLVRSLQRLFAIPSGFESSNVLTIQVPAPRIAADASQQFFDRALEAVRSVPGVERAGFTSQLPLSGDRDEYGVHFEAEPERPAETYSAFRYAVSPDYVETMGIPLKRGRRFDARDRAGSVFVAVISESLARTRFGSGDPIGRRLRIGPTDGPPYTIVGVVGDVRQLSLALAEADAVYIPASQWPFPEGVMSLVLRAGTDAAKLTPSVRAAIWSVDRGQPIVRVALLDDLVAASAGERRFAVVLFEAFALAALVLAAAGIYGVLAGSVAERTREIGVRSALGATRANVLGLVFRQGLGLVGVGAVVGVAGAALASRLIAGLLIGISRFDPLTYLGTATLLLAVAALACSIPAWRAMRIDPAMTLRAE
jgi:putative ABC transport system permease protein